MGPAHAFGGACELALEFQRAPEGGSASAGVFQEPLLNVSHHFRFFDDEDWLGSANDNPGVPVVHAANGDCLQHFATPVTPVRRTHDNGAANTEVGYPAAWHAFVN